jgi:hypothetical protein
MVEMVIQTQVEFILVVAVVVLAVLELMDHRLLMDLEELEQDIL